MSDPASTATTTTRRAALAWAVEHPGQAVGALALAIAILRLLSVSYGKLRTAAALLETADLAALATGVVLFASVLWIPLVVAVLTRMALSSFGRIAAAAGLTLSLLLVALIVGFASLDVAEIALGGWFIPLAVFAGAGIGCVAAFIRPAPRTDATAARTAADGALARVAAASTEVAAATAVSQEEEEEEEEEEQDLTDRIFSGIASAIGFGWVGLLTLSLMVMVFALLFSVLSEPSQPAEALTVRTPDGEVTKTFHVLDDSGEEWLLMARDDRELLSVDAADVRDRYVCSTIDIDVVGLRIWAREMLSAGGERQAELLRQLDVEENRDWRDDLEAQPPACDLELSSADVAEIRRLAGISCPTLLRCES